jgi:Domain of unknown function (DUF4253)
MWGWEDSRMVDEQVLDSYQRAGVVLPGLRPACVTGGGRPVWTVHPLPPKREPFASWVRLRAAHDQTGLWPFLAGSALKEVNRQAISELWDDAATAHDPTAVQRGLALDVRAFFTDRAAELAVPDPATLSVDAAALAWADRQPQFAFTSRDTVIGLIQADHGWQVPGLLSWNGAANYDLDGAHHVAVLRHWQQRYGAELVTLTGDHIELLVARPPRDPTTITQVAVEMLGYCPDLDVLGAGMVAVLAQEVVPHRCWSFWWD